MGLLQPLCDCRPPFFGAQCERWRCGGGKCNVNATGLPHCTAAAQSSPLYHHSGPDKEGSVGRREGFGELCSLACKRRGPPGGVVGVPCNCSQGMSGPFCGDVAHCNRRGRLVKPSLGPAYCHCFQVGPPAAEAGG